MHKVFSSLMLVLSLSTVVSALISQTQVLDLGSANTVLIGGAGCQGWRKEDACQVVLCVVCPSRQRSSDR